MYVRMRVLDPLELELQTVVSCYVGAEGFFVFQDRVSLYHISGCPQSPFVDQAGLELTQICLLLPPKYWD